MTCGAGQMLPCWQQETLDAVGEVMRQAHGLDVSCYEPSFVAKAIERRRQETGNETLEAYVAHLAEVCGESELLHASLRVSYSEFFRNPLSFALLEEVVLPRLVEAKTAEGESELRVWSAGCAAGQEAYSVAILLEELTVLRDVRLAHRIFATDQSEEALAQGRAGVYGEAAVANVRLRQLGHAFERKGEMFVAAPWLKGRVDFSAYDLLDAETSFPPASIYGGFNLVMCCNVLLYYRAEAQRIILDKIRRSLAADGVLVVGETERAVVEQTGGFFAMTAFTSVYQKA